MEKSPTRTRHLRGATSSTDPMCRECPEHSRCFALRRKASESQPRRRTTNSPSKRQRRGPMGWETKGCGLRFAAPPHGSGPPIVLSYCSLRQPSHTHREGGRGQQTLPELFHWDRDRHGSEHVNSLIYHFSKQSSLRKALLSPSF